MGTVGQALERLHVWDVSRDTASAAGSAKSKSFARAARDTAMAA